jgi:hypothetical protein
MTRIELFHWAADRPQGIVLEPGRGARLSPWLVEELHEAWRAAQREVEDAYRYWHEAGRAEAYAVYRAAQG